MASAAEQMAANLSWGALGKATELRQRIWFTLGLLIIYRLGTYIPVPGIDGGALRNFMEQAQAGIGGILSMFTGGALGRMGVFALGIMPYISASIIVQLLASMVPALEQMKKEGEQGRKKINQYTRYATVALALFQAWGLAVSLEAGNLAHDPGLFFRATVVITLVGGTMFLMWLGEQITARGIGNGISLIIFAGIVAVLPGTLARLFGLAQQGQISAFTLLFIAALLLTYLGFSAASIVHQAWGATLGADEAQLARTVAWREGLGLAGVLLAALTPQLGGASALVGLFAFALIVGLVLVWRAPDPAQPGGAGAKHHRHGRPDGRPRLLGGQASRRDRDSARFCVAAGGV